MGKMSKYKRDRILGLILVGIAIISSVILVFMMVIFGRAMSGEYIGLTLTLIMFIVFPTIPGLVFISQKKPSSRPKTPGEDEKRIAEEGDFSWGIFVIVICLLAPIIFIFCIPFMYQALSIIDELIPSNEFISDNIAGGLTYGMVPSNFLVSAIIGFIGLVRAENRKEFVPLSFGIFLVAYGGLVLIIWILWLIDFFLYSLSLFFFFFFMSPLILIAVVGFILGGIALVRKILKKREKGKKLRI